MLSNGNFSFETSNLFRFIDYDLSNNDFEIGERVSNVFFALVDCETSFLVITFATYVTFEW